MSTGRTESPSRRVVVGQVPVQQQDLDRRPVPAASQRVLHAAAHQASRTGVNRPAERACSSAGGSGARRPGPASAAVLAGVDLDTALRCLGLLAAGDFVRRVDQGWRARKDVLPDR